jgi:TP901 family phage tail tape measure protein
VVRSGLRPVVVVVEQVVGRGAPFQNRFFAGRVALGTLGAMGIYAGVGEAGQVLGGSDYRQYTTSQARIQGYTGPQGQQIARQAYNQYLTSAPRLGMRPTDAMEGLYFITSSIQNKGQALNLSNAAMRTAAAGGVPVTDTAKFLAQFANNYGPAMRTRGQINNFANAANQAVRVGTMEWADLPHIVTPSIGRSAGLGITPQQLLAMAAQLSNRYSPGQAAPMLTNLVSQLNAPIGQQIKTAQMLGLDWMAVRKDLKQGNLSGAVGLVNTALSQGPVSADDIEQRTHGMITGKAAVNYAQRLQTRQQRERTLFGGNRSAFTAWEALFAGGSLPQFNKTLGQVGANQGSVQQSIDIRLNSPQGKLDKMLGELEAFKIRAEKTLEPLRETIEKAVGGALEGIVKNGPKIKAFFTGIGDAVGPVASAIKTRSAGRLAGSSTNSARTRRKFFPSGQISKHLLRLLGLPSYPSARISKSLEPLVKKSIFSGDGRGGAGGVGKSLADGIILALKGR